MGQCYAIVKNGIVMKSIESSQWLLFDTKGEAQEYLNFMEDDYRIIKVYVSITKCPREVHD